MLLHPIDAYGETLDNILKRRGLVVEAKGDILDLVFPFERYEELIPHRGSRYSPQGTHQYFDLFQQISFRKVLRRIISGRADGRSIGSLREVWGDAVDDYIAFLLEKRIIRTAGDLAFMDRRVDNLGPSLEHYVAHLCEERLSGSADWGMKLRGLPSGGDFDVLAWLSPKLVYIECKSGNPVEIGVTQLSRFIVRQREIGADIAILLVDTDGDISELVSRLNDAIEPWYSTHDDVKDVYGIRRRGVQFNISFDSMRVEQSADYESIYFGYHSIYVVNTKSKILEQIRRCLAHHYAYAKQYGLFLAKFMSG